MWISRVSIKPAYYPCAKGKHMVNPIFRVIFFFLAWCWFTS